MNETKDDLTQPQPPGRGVFLISSFHTTGPETQLVMEAPDLDAQDSSFLFALPEYGNPLKNVLEEALEEFTRKKSPVLRTIPSLGHQRVQTTHVTVGEQVVSNPPMLTKLRYAFTVGDVVDFDLNALAAACDEAAETLTDARIDSLLDYVGRITDATGNVVQCGGQAINWGLLFPLLEKQDIDFNDAGEPDLPILVAEWDKRNILPYPPMSGAEEKRFEELMSLKREEFNARRGRS